jgi:putative oxidoreductase
MREKLNQYAPAMLSILRIVTGLIFLAHGTQKFLGFPAGDMAGSGLALDNLGAVAGIIELVAGALLVLGLLTRVAAFISSGTMAVAYWYAHAPQNFFPVNNAGDAAILYCFVFLYLVFAGPGPYSIDAALYRRRSDVPPS